MRRLPPSGGYPRTVATTDVVNSLAQLPAWTPYAAVLVGGLVGASHAARQGFDVIGVLGLAIAGGLGGLLLRDVLLQKGTPVVLTDPRYLLTATLAALLGFFFAGLISSLGRVLMVLDALSLGLFATLGASAALYYGMGPAPAVFLGLTTAVGGIILRDVLSGEPPSIMRPGIFIGVAALFGACVFVGLRELGVSSGLAQIATILVVFGLRLLAVWRKWESPTSIDLTDRMWELWSRHRDPAADDTGSGTGSGSGSGSGDDPEQNRVGARG